MACAHLNCAMPGIKLNRVEDEGIVEPRRFGLGLMTVGKLLLWVDFLLLAFVYDGIRSGSRMWLWWVIGQGVIGLILIEIGWRRRGSLTR
jgi:hypothetical protein